MLHQQGFTLLELLITLLIVSILAMISYPSYNHFILKTRRTDAQIALLDLASSMERYYAINNTYMGATLADLMENKYTNEGYYQLEITQSTQDTYLLQALPEQSQTRDSACGTLGINQLGEKTISGNDQVENCWGF